MYSYFVLLKIKFNKTTFKYSETTFTETFLPKTVENVLIFAKN